MHSLVRRAPYVCTRCSRSLNSTVLQSPITRNALHGPRSYSTTTTVSSHGRPRIAVIGSGPAGFYTAYKVMSRLDRAVIDMYEALPVPFGLVRFGVAPDHPEVKNCQDKFTEVAQSPRFNFIGNIAVGHDLPLSVLRPHYDAILFAFGASEDRQLGIPGESTLRGVYSARAFVGWYNGLPQFADLDPALDAGEEAVVIGQGNVALDVARILLSDLDVLRKSDITEAALATLAKSRVKRVRVVGRRGPQQAAFTIKELRELMTLPGVAFDEIDPVLLPSDPSKLPRAQKRIAQLLAKGGSTPASSAHKSWGLRFLLSPKEFKSDSPEGNHLSSVSLEEQTFQEGSDSLDPKAKVESTGRSASLPASLAFRSIGYKSTPLPGLADLDVPFDDRLGIIPNDLHGRVINPSAGPGEMTAKHVPGLYCAGWVKRGPTGVIASTMDDAFTTADVIARDWTEQAIFLNGTPDDSGGGTGLGLDAVGAEAEKRGLQRVSWKDWEKIDAAEKERGRRLGKEREKFGTVREMLQVLN